MFVDVNGYAMPRTLARWSGALAALLLLLTAPALAQSPAAVPPPQAAQQTAPQSGAADQLEGLVSTLEDAGARARLVDQLRTLIAAQKGGASPPSAAAPSDLLPDALGSRTLSYLARHVEDASRQLLAVANAFSDLPAVGEWMHRQMDDPSARERWTQLSIDLVLIVIVGAAVSRFASWLLRRPRRALEGRRCDQMSAKLTFLVLRLALEVVPVVAFTVVAYGILTLGEAAMMSVGSRVRHVVIDVIAATVVVQTVLVIASFLFAPSAPGLRLTRMRDETAAYAYVWTRRLAIVGVYGYFLADGAFVFGLALGAYGALLKLLGLVMAAMLIILILQNRVPVAEWLQGNPLTGDGDPVEVEAREAEGQGAVMRTARRRLADVWHLLAVGYVAIAFGAWALNVYDGFEYLAKATVVSVAIFVVARLLVTGINRALRRGFRISPELAVQFPTLEVRANRYIPVLHRVIKTLIWTVATLMILNAWGVDTAGWIETPVGRRVVRSVATIGVMLAVAIVAWEVVSALIERFLRGTEVQGTRIERSARMRTLLPLLRNAFLVVLVTMVSLITLAELGVNIAPLLAGAGVVGLAVGFGSQTLVKDVITGLFILFEDTISVGDVVDVGGGHSGVVEAISIRTIRLRDGAGAVHSVPFSAVTTVKNMTKDYSFAVFDVSVSYGEDPDRVCDALGAVGSEMQADPLYAHDILAPLEVMGIERFADSAVVIRARFKTRPLKQWNVGREFNRRMKKAFDEQGISMPYPHMHLVMEKRREAAG